MLQIWPLRPRHSGLISWQSSISLTRRYTLEYLGALEFNEASNPSRGHNCRVDNDREKAYFPFFSCCRENEERRFPRNYRLSMIIKNFLRRLNHSSVELLNMHANYMRKLKSKEQCIECYHFQSICLEFVHTK